MCARAFTRKTRCAVCEVVPDWEKVARTVGCTPKATQGLLHGMPVSLKECLTYPGLPATMGDAKRLSPAASTTALVVKVRFDPVDAARYTPPRLTDLRALYRPSFARAPSPLSPPTSHRPC